MTIIDYIYKNYPQWTAKKMAEIKKTQMKSVTKPGALKPVQVPE